MAILVTSKLRFVRDTLSALIASSGYEGPVEAVGFVRAARADFEPPRALLVVSEPGEGIQLVSEFRSVHRATPIGVLAPGDRDEDFIAWSRIGISGYAEPDTGADGIVSMITRVAEGEIVFPARLSGLLLNRFAAQSRVSTSPGGLEALTRREVEVIELLADGRANKQIARRLAITDATVKNHVHNILEKLNLKSRGEAAAFYRRPTVSNPSPRFDYTPVGPLSVPAPYGPGNGATKTLETVAGSLSE